MAQLKLEELGVVTATEKGKQVFKGKQLNPSITAAALGEVGTETVGIIKAVDVVEFEDGEKVMLQVLIDSLRDTKEGALRRIGLNKTNLIRMLNLFGIDSDKWLQKQINIKVETTLFKGNEVACIRLYRD